MLLTSTQSKIFARELAINVNAPSIPAVVAELAGTATVKKGTLYIDGGIEVFVDENNNGAPIGNKTIGYNMYPLEVDMMTSWDWRNNITVIAVNKTANLQTGTAPPLVVNAALYPGASNDTNIYLYRGTVSFVNTSFPGFEWPESEQYSLWSYDTVGKTWSQYAVTLNAPNRPSSGAYAEAPELGLAFWLNGKIDTGTSNILQNLSGFERYLDGLIVINTSTQTARNLSTASLASFPRIGGSMVYIQGIGSKGILVAVGGTTKSVHDSSDLTTGTYVTFDKIDFFDVASLDDGSQNGTWYLQKDTGDIPPPRKEFCLVAASAPDNSSHNIYLYGGRDETQQFDDIYTLSLPSFTWTKIYEGQSPRYGHTCHLVGNRQMITVGGVDSPELQRGCDWETKSVAIYDLSLLVWGSVYNVFAPPYEVPGPIYRVVGGSAQGGASMKAPSGGFSTPQIAQLFGYSASNNSTNNTSPNATTAEGHGGLSGGAIAGVMIGSVAGAFILAGLAFFLIRRRRRRDAADHPPEYSPEEQKPEAGNNDDAYGGVIARNRPGVTAELSSPPPAQELLPSSVVHEIDTDPNRQIAVELDSQPRKA